VFSWGLLLKIPAFMRVKHRDFSDEIRSFLISPTALLCLLTRRECICCCLHLSSICNQVSGSVELHMGHVIEGYCWWRHQKTLDLRLGSIVHLTALGMKVPTLSTIH
jgi:hypothetical protein